MDDMGIVRADRSGLFCQDARFVGQRIGNCPAGADLGLARSWEIRGSVWGKTAEQRKDKP